MAIDLSQFKQTFLEESDEGLDILESGLLALDSGTADDEVIHAVFRAAHSIKGGAGTFSLHEVASFTHVMETLLDEMRDGRRAISSDAVNILLNSVDVLRELLNAARDDLPPEMERVSEVQAQLENLLALSSDEPAQDIPQGQAGEAESASEEPALTQMDAKQIGWIIKFCPHEHLLRTGNDTVRIFKELSLLGSMDNSVSLSGLPEFDHLDPELSYLSWDISLKSSAQQGEIDKAVIEEIFEWVEDDCDLSIEPLFEKSVAVETATEAASENIVVSPAESQSTVADLTSIAAYSCGCREK